jgi:hypothetical protein
MHKVLYYNILIQDKVLSFYNEFHLKMKAKAGKWQLTHENGSK